MTLPFSRNKTSLNHAIVTKTLNNDLKSRYLYFIERTTQIKLFTKIPNKMFEIFNPLTLWAEISHPTL